MRSLLVSLSDSASWAEAELSLKRMAEQASGLMTLYQANSIMATLSATPMPSAPPEPPSPQTIERIGVFRRDISNMLRAIDSAWPRSSAPMPG